MQTTYLSKEAWDALTKEMDAPREPSRPLVELMARVPLWELPFESEKDPQTRIIRSSEPT